MKIEVLITTINFTKKKLLEQMNIQTDAIVGNQTNYNDVEEFNFNDNRIKVYSFNERGVGLNRNNLLMRTDADIAIIADDDLRYIDGYEDIVIKMFEKHVHADVILFNLMPDNKVNV